MVDFAMTTPLQDENVTRAPLQILTDLLSEVSRRSLSHLTLEYNFPITKALSTLAYVTRMYALHQSLRNTFTKKLFHLSYDVVVFTRMI